MAGGHGRLKRVWLRTAAKSVRFIKSGKAPIDLGAIPEGTILVGKENRCALDSSTCGGARGVQFQQSKEGVGL